MSSKPINEVAIWNGIINPDAGDLSESEANVVLRWSFSDEDKRHMEDLANRNGEGELLDEERELLQAYVDIGQVIGILQAKARLSLKHLNDKHAG